MRPFVAGILCLPMFVVGGCGGASTSHDSLPSPHHGGSIVALPGDRGFVELKTERLPVSKGKSATPAKSRILVYFYKSDGTTEMSPVPGDVSLKLGTAESGTDIKLSPEPKEPGLLASAPARIPMSSAVRSRSLLMASPSRQIS